MVAVGSVDELRERDAGRGARRARAAGPAGPTGVPGVEVVGGRRTATRGCGSRPASTTRTCCGAALAAGPVHEFRRWRPPLTELYRDVVEAGPVAERQDVPA